MKATPANMKAAWFNADTHDVTDICNNSIGTNLRVILPVSISRMWAIDALFDWLTEEKERCQGAFCSKAEWDKKLSD